MNFIDMYNKIESRTKALMKKGFDKEKARIMAWNEIHKEIYCEAKNEETKKSDKSSSPTPT